MGRNNFICLKKIFFFENLQNHRIFAVRICGKIFEFTFGKLLNWITYKTLEKKIPSIIENLAKKQKRMSSVSELIKEAKEIPRKIKT